MSGSFRPSRVALFLALLVLAAAGCSGGDAATGVLLDLVADGRYTVGAEGAEEPLRFPAPPEVFATPLGHERREVVVLPAGSWSWRTRVPEGGRLHVGLGFLGEAPVEAVVTRVRDGEREVLEVARHPGGAAWLDFGVDLARFAGQEVTLELAARLGAGGEASPEAEALIGWGPVVVTGSGPARPADRPNVLFILVDTLRYDHLTPYGYERDTSPEIQRLLADAGTVMEDAYSQAPWTLPSAVSYMTSREPGEILGEDPATFAIPSGVPALGDVMEELGYRTAAFNANPTLHEGNGFARGFQSFYAPEELQAIQAHADELNRRAIPWLRAHGAHPEKPFFLYVHYIDPHDPYWNPDVVDGRSPYFDDPGGIDGRWVHGVYTGRIPVDDLEREVRHLTALYDTEIRYVDRAVGELLASLPEGVLANTLVVLTADHGEELHDHGYWKHGHTLYEDQIHVPLLFRWDGRIPAGRRLAGTVRLLDVAPTLVEAAGGEPPEAFAGVSLLPALTGEKPLPRLAAFAQHLQVGPLRAASILDGKKLVLFNREEPFTPSDGIQAHAYEKDMARLARRELYDLERDPAEQENLLAGDGGAAPSAPTADALASRLASIVYRGVDRAVPGLRALTDALPPGARLVGSLTFERPPAAVVPLFSGSDDRLEAAGREVRFELVGEAVAPVPKGFRVLGEPGALVAATLSLDGEPLPDGRLRTGKGRPYTGRPVPAETLATGAPPSEADLPGLRLWSPAGVTALATEVNEQTREGLRALGYIQ